jgi:hypothetical protein
VHIMVLTDYIHSQLVHIFLTLTYDIFEITIQYLVKPLIFFFLSAWMYTLTDIPSQLFYSVYLDMYVYSNLFKYPYSES